MTTKTKNKRKSVARSQRTGDERAANVQRTRYLFAPIMQNFRSYLRKDVANAPQIWLPIECNLIFRYEFAACSLQTRYIFVAILLYCGQRGIDEVPDDKRFLASALNADARTIEKAIQELENLQLLVERKKEREEKEKTDRQTEGAFARVCVDDLNLSKTEDENQSSLLNEDVEPSHDEKSVIKHSQFTIEECLKYVEACIAKGERVQSPKALAQSIYQTASSDSFILATLYPERAQDLEAQHFGKPILFHDEPCRVCFGAKLADADGKGFRACEHCRNERGKSTGKEPEGENNAND